jgi:hypothetical protein
LFFTAPKSEAKLVFGFDENAQKLAQKQREEEQKSEQENQAILASLQSEGEDYFDFEVNVGVIGDIGVGKSSLVEGACVVPLFVRVSVCLSLHNHHSLALSSLCFCFFFLSSFC